MARISIPLPKNTIDETGHTYGRLKVREYGDLLDAKAAWLCDCECGETALVRGDKLRNGRVVSCGCYRADPNIRQPARMKTPAKRRIQIAGMGGAATAGRPRKSRR